MSSPPPQVSRARSGSMSSVLRPNPSLARPLTTFRSTIRNPQPAYNLITGEESSSQSPTRQSYAAESVRPGSRESSKENMAPLDADEYEKYRRDIESLKAEIGTIQYRMQTAQQEHEITRSQQNNKLEQYRRREIEQSHLKQAAEAARTQAEEQAAAAKKELDDLREAKESELAAAERRAREAQTEAHILQEQLDDLSSAKDQAARVAEKRFSDVQTQLTACQNSLLELEQVNASKDTALQQAYSQAAEKEAQISQLEAQVLQLRAHSGDAEVVDKIKADLSEQVQHIRTLEKMNSEHLAELKKLRASSKAAEILEEEKRSLVRKLASAELLQEELAEARLQRQRLEDERLAWTSYLNLQQGQDAEFESPQDMARALAQERLTSASYMEQLGGLRAEMLIRENNIHSLQEEKAQLKEEISAARANADVASVDKARARLDRQRALAVKEAEFLRLQLHNIDHEQQAMQPETYNQSTTLRLRELETLVDQYKAEVQALHTELLSMESIESGTPAKAAAAGIKRAHSQDDESHQEQLGQLNRKNRKLQDELAHVQTSLALAEKDLLSSREQLSAAKLQNQTRVLSLRSNPTSDHEAFKRSTLEALQKENHDLLATLRCKQRDPSIPLIPTSVLGAMEREIAAAKAETMSAQKSARRLKEVWSAKSQEFKEAIFSTLGWTVTFIPNGKMRVESTFYPSQTDEHENSIVFDGERGTMKVGGGPKSAFARRIADQIGFWVREKGCIPGFLAALTLEFYEEQNKTMRVD
ncbi:hypothetical protein CDD82_2712 [Ophiocordyceps australis]|uniref:Spindle assembly checkpoint component MAD1 n=1 Tax=Ophiocordyceps australis TaxID=1399860 RepID=A0A2C5XTL1_9HYPO|nr:hypothetical protein CDD82_2712 [Ophiocordyceps australis]